MAEDPAFDLFFSQYLQSCRPKDLERLRGDPDLFALVQKEARRLWWEFMAKSRQRLNYAIFNLLRKK